MGVLIVLIELTVALSFLKFAIGSEWVGKAMGRTDVWAVLVVLFLLLCAATVPNVHAEVMNNYFRKTDNANIAPQVLEMLKSPVNLVIWFFSYYMVSITVLIGKQFVLNIGNFHHYLESLLNAVSDYLLVWFARALEIPFNSAIEAMKWVTERIGLEMKQALEFFQQVGTILLGQYSAARDQAILTWFGQGKTKEDKMKMAFIALFAQLVLILLPTMVCLYYAFKYLLFSSFGTELTKVFFQHYEAAKKGEAVKE